MNGTGEEIMTDGPDSGASPSNRRIYSRIDWEVQVDLRSENTFFTGFSENVSEGGLFIATEVPFDIGHRLEVKLSLMGGAPTTHQVLVRWVRPGGAAGGLPAGMGVQFDDMSDEELNRLQDFIDSRAKDTLFFDLD